MPLDEIRYHLRVTLSDLARGVQTHALLAPFLHREEAPEQLWLRVITWAVFWAPELVIAPPGHDPDAPDLFADDATGRKEVWIAVDPERAERVGRALRHNRGARIGVAFSASAALERFLGTARGVRGLETAEFLQVEERLLHEMAGALDERRYDLAITLLEDHLYLDAGNRRTFDGTFRRRRGLPA